MLQPVINGHGTGHLFDLPDPRDWSATASGGPLFGAAARYPDSWDLARHGVAITDQGPESSCVSHSLAGAVDLYAMLQQLRIPPVSRRAIYALARHRHTPKQAPKLRDEGCYPRLAAEALREVGLVAYDRLKDDFPIDERAPWDVITAGADAKVQGYYKITERRMDRCHAICRALSKDWPVPYGQIVDDTYFAYAGGVYPGLRGPGRGGHAQTLVSYRTRDGRLEFRTKNSWSTRWGDHGMAWIDQDFIASEYVSDVYML